MYKLGGRKKLGKKASHRRAMINNQLKSLLNESKVKTTTPKAKVLKANADSYLAKVAKMDAKTVAKSLAQYVSDENVLKVLTKYISGTPAVKIVRVGFRAGDNAEVSRVYLDGYDPKGKKKSGAKKADKVDEKKDSDTKGKGPGSDRSERGVKNVAKTVRNAVVGKERARSRSGL